jgi:hypothetical protein
LETLVTSKTQALKSRQESPKKDLAPALGLMIVDAMETLPRHTPGMDWGARRRVLARNEDSSILLFIREGYSSASCGIRGFGREYHPVSITLWARESWAGHAGWASQEVGENRFDAAKVQRDHGALIDKVFGCPGLSARLDGRKTIVVPGTAG